jgi:hypothetical protein
MCLQQRERVQQQHRSVMQVMQSRKKKDNWMACRERPHAHQDTEPDTQGVTPLGHT